jgi:hypothetical protein
MEGFKSSSAVDLPHPEPKSNYKVILCSSLDTEGFVIAMVEEGEPKYYWEVVNGRNRYQ